MGSLGSSHCLVRVDRVTCCTRRELLLVWWLVVRVLSQRGISAASAPLKLDDHCSCLSSLWSSAVLSARRVSGHFYTACIPARGCRWDKRWVRGTIETRGSGENSIMNALRFPSSSFFFFCITILLFCMDIFYFYLFCLFIYFFFSMKIMRQGEVARVKCVEFFLHFWKMAKWFGFHVPSSFPLHIYLNSLERLATLNIANLKVNELAKHKSQALWEPAVRTCKYHQET